MVCGVACCCMRALRVTRISIDKCGADGFLMFVSNEKIP